MEITFDIAKLTEDVAEELLFYNRKWLCSDLNLQIHELRKVGNLLKVLRTHIKYEKITLYPYLNRNKEFLLEQGSSKNKQDTWELSYRSIVCILLNYDIKLRCIDDLDVSPIDKLRQIIANNKEEITQIQNRIDELEEKKNDIEYEMDDLRGDLQLLVHDNDEKLKLITQLESLL
jgi:FtsZ-binding cell division protein ZapB